MIDPYRLFFPLGAAYAIAGAGIWVLSAHGALSYPAALHRALMIEGFEQCFIAGFLLTAMPGMLHGGRPRPVDVGLVFVLLVAFGAFAFAGAWPLAHAAFTASILALLATALQRLRHATQPPPVEFLFVALGLGLGALGGALLTVEAAAAPFVMPFRFADRLLSLGMVLSLVLGVGGLLVPTFTGMRDPLEIPFVARAHERAPRVMLYLALAAALLASFALEWLGHAGVAGWVRAVAGTAVLLLVWKLPRLPGRRDLSAFAMWGSGWIVLAGLWMLVALPEQPMAGLHVVFIGGFGLLTFAIGTRVIVAHGRHGLPAERVIFNRGVAILLALALLARVPAEWTPRSFVAHLGWAGALWALAWLVWAWRAMPRIARVNPPPPAAAGLVRPSAGAPAPVPPPR